MGGVSLSIVPGKAGELIKSELLKIKFNIPRSKSVSIIIVEQVYSGIGLVVTSLFGLYYFDLGIGDKGDQFYKMFGQPAHFGATTTYNF